MKPSTVGHVSVQIRGVSYDKSVIRTQQSQGYLPLLRGGNIGDHGLIWDDLQYVPQSIVSTSQVLRAGDVVLAASSGSLSAVGKAASFDKALPATFGAFCKALRPNELVYPGYFSHYFRTTSYRRQISALAEGVNINNLRKEHLNNLAFPLPPLDEQRRIAAILDKADELRSMRREALAHLDALTQSIFHLMFGDDVWSRTTLRDASLRFVGGRNLVGSGANAHPENKVLKVNAVSGGFFDSDQTKPLPADYLPPAEHLVATGDLIVTRASGTKDLIGVATPVSHVQDNTYLPDKLWKAKMNPGMLCPTFLRFLTKSTRYREFVANSSSGAAGVSNISQAKLLAFEFGLPPLELQQTFATRVAAVERLKELHRKHLAELDALFASLQHRAFKGEL